MSQVSMQLCLQSITLNRCGSFFYRNCTC